MKLLRMIFLLVVGFAVYAVLDTKNDRDHVSELKSKPQSELSDNDKRDLAEADKAEKERLNRKKVYEEEQRKESLKNKPQRDFVELQLKVRMACEDTARSRLKYPDSFRDEQHEDGVSDESGKKVYYYTLHYSAINAFNARSTSTIECYADVGKPDNKVTYRLFD